MPAEAIVFLHGNLSRGSHWQPQLDARPRARARTDQRRCLVRGRVVDRIVDELSNSKPSL